VLYADGTAVQPDLKRAMALFERGCELGEPTACFNLANHCAEGTGVAQDQARAAKLYARACSLGYEPACAKAATGPPHSPR
jgi:TPR repeat protein